MREINERLSALTARFRRNLLADTAALAVRVETAGELDGMAQTAIDAAARAAEAASTTIAPPSPRSPPSGPSGPAYWASVPTPST